MPKYSRLHVPFSPAASRAGRAALVAALVAGAAACGEGKSEDNALGQDSALSRDLALAGQGDSAQPALQDVPSDSAVAPTPLPNEAPVPAPAPARTTPRAPTRTASGAATRPAPRPTAPRPTATRPTPADEPTRTASGNAVTRNAGEGAAAERSGTGAIPAGTTIALASNSKVCTNTNRVGDRFTARVAETVAGSNGATIPAGATATVEVTQLDRSENVRDQINMGFRVVSITFGGRTYAVDASTEGADVTRVRNQPAGKDRQKVIGGAVAGAIAGQILGRDTKGTVIGAATGAAAGAAAAAATANYEGCVNEGARITIRLDQSTQVRI
jgi:hypothetical protein